MHFDVLDPLFSVRKRCILEASAGTGKTFAIEHLFLRLILEENIPFEKILVVTFTKKATQELKTRILQTLKKALFFFQKPSLFEEPLFPYLKKEPSEMEKKALLLEEVLHHFERASIFTIHAFCQKMLQEFSFEAKIPFFSKEEPSFPPFSFFSHFLQNLKETDFSPFEMDILLKHVSFSLTYLFSSLMNFLENKEIYSAPPSIYEIYQKVFSLFSSLSEKEISLFEEMGKKDFERTLTFYKKTGFSIETLEKEWEFIESFFKKAPSFEEFIKLLSLSPCLMQFLHPENKKKSAKAFSLEELSSYPLFHWLEKSLYPLLEEALLFSRSFKRLAYLFRPFYLSLIEEGSLFSFSEIMKNMEKALLFPEFSKRVQEKFAASIVDEFQDTDPIQWKILSHLFDLSPILYLVGDPKQSIYGFRKADIYTYLRAKDRIGLSLHLDTNYRSSPDLVEALNRLFGKISKNNWLALPQQKNFLPYHPVKSGSLLPKTGKDPLCFFVFDKEKNKKTKEKEIENLFFFPFLAKIIETYKNSSYKIAILVKDRFQGKKVQQYLRERGIFFSIKSSEPLGKTAAFSYLKLFFEAVFSLSFSKIQTALLTPFCGWHFSDLEKEKIPYEVFFTLQEKMREGLPFFFDSFLQAILSLEKKSVEELSFLQKEGFYEDLLQIIDLLLFSLGKEKITKEVLFSFLEKVEEQIESSSKEKRKFLGSEENVIMTMHMSKGLEFDIVFALGVTSKMEKKDSLLEKEEIEEIDAEKLRQFYVALTRAKKQVFVPYILDPEKKQLPGKSSPIDLFFSYLFYQKPYQNISRKTWEESIEKQFSLVYLSSLYIPKKEKAEKEKPQREKMPLLPSYKKGNTLFSFSSLSEGSTVPKELQEPFLFPRGPFLGDFVHQLMQKMVETQDVDAIQKKVSKSEYAPFLDSLTWIIQKAFSISLPGHSFSLLQVPKKQMWAEVPFFFSHSIEKKMKGFIDLFFFFEGKYYLLDWKTNDLGDKKENYQKEALEKEMIREDYFFQASLYREALEQFFSKQKELNPFKFGGMFYLFLRGLFFEEGIYHFFPDTQIAKNRFKEM